MKYSAAALSRYRRLYLRAPDPVDGYLVEPAYDVATEVSFASKEDMALAPKLKTPEITAIIEADAANFLDPSTRNFVFAKDCESAIPAS